jgi:hypothetical protein
MIPFDREQFTVQYVKLKSVSTALSGSMKIVNEEASQSSGYLVTDRIRIPFALARAFKKSNAVSNFMAARDAAVVWYGNQVVMLELRPSFSTTTTDGEDRWVSKCERNITNCVLPMMDDGRDWYTDGVYIYSLPEMQQALDSATNLTMDGKFKGINVSCIKFMHLMDINLIDTTHTRSIVAVISENNHVVLTPPIWKNIYDNRSSSMTSIEVDNELSAEKGRFDSIAELYDVNLEFALNAGRTVGAIFGNEHIQPIRLPELMISLGTVNLPKVPKSIRETFGVGLPFLHAFAWIAGLMAKCDSMENYMAMRGLMKHLMQKGMYKSAILKKVQDVHSLNVTIKMLTKDEAVENVLSRMSKEDMQNYWMSFQPGYAKSQKTSNSNIAIIEQRNTVGMLD